MMKRRTNAYGRMTTSATASSGEEEIKCEVRPGGMLVQQRKEIKDGFVPNVRLQIVYGAVRLEISVSSQATFGEVKKVLAAETGLEAAEQSLTFRGRKRENGEYLDACGVKDRSKLVLAEDPSSIERRYVQMRRSAKADTALRAISDVSVEVDKLAEQVCAMEKSISEGVKVPEVQITTLIEMLMRQAVRLDNIPAEGEACARKSLQAKRVQKSVETLDALKISNPRVKPVVPTPKWETFDPPRTTNPWEIFD